MPHIIYIILNIIILILTIILCGKGFLKRKKLIIEIAGIILFVLVIVNRFSITIYDNVIASKDASWWELLPNSICGLSSLLLALAIIFGKEDNWILNSVSYLGFFGSAIVIFYPDFLITQPFFCLRSITGLLHHSLMNLLIIVMMITGYIKPSRTKFKYLIIMMAFYMTYGIFLIDALGIDNAMQIGKPLIKNAPILTSWYVVFLATTVVTYLYEWLFDFFRQKSKKNSLFK